MTRLIPMTVEQYDAWKADALSAYAVDKERVLNIAPDAARDLALASFDGLLPDGMQTTDAHFYVIADDAGGPVGALWFSIRREWGQCECFVYDIVIDRDHRRHGHARAALEALVPLAAELGATKIGLHVFADNPGAVALYEACGFETKDLIMAKQVAL